VHRSITLVDFQLDEQNSYLFTYNTFIKILYMFQALPCSSSRGLRLGYRHSLQVTVLCTRQRVAISEAAYIKLRRGPPDDEQDNARNM